MVELQLLEGLEHSDGARVSMSGRRGEMNCDGNISVKQETTILNFSFFCHVKQLQQHYEQDHFSYQNSKVFQNFSYM